MATKNEAHKERVKLHRVLSRFSGFKSVTVVMLQNRSYGIEALFGSAPEERIPDHSGSVPVRLAIGKSGFS